MKFFNSVLRHDGGIGMDVIRRNAQLLERDTDGDTADRAETIASWSDDIIDLTKKVRRMLDAVTSERDHSLSQVDLAETVRNRTDHVEPMDAAATIDATLPTRALVKADDMLPEVVVNLLSNAIEHNDADEPRVEVSISAGDETVTLDIADNGPGIPDDDKQCVFRWGETCRSSDGGFGLYFVETMVDFYGGSVAVRDTEPPGTVFSVTLPRP
jgi:signal transduction histidine kinase